MKIRIKNKGRKIAPLIAGLEAPTRVIANIGVSPRVTTLEGELSKAQAAVEAGADIIADHTITNENDIENIIRGLVEKVDVPVSTVPYYAAAVKALRERGAIVHVRPRDLLDIFGKQANLGVDMMTVHASITKKLLQKIITSQRIIKMTSRGGTWVGAYMIYHDCENPLFEHFDEILEICKSYGITLSLGPSLRTGSIVDQVDDIVWEEIGNHENLVLRALEKGVKTVVEYGGHIKADNIGPFVRKVKSKCHDVPLRPLITCTDIAVGCDHISAAIAATIAAMNGADMLTAITRGEHIGLPRLEDTVEGVIAFKIAAHIADTVKKGDIEKDRQISHAREKRNWGSMFRYAIHPSSAEKMFHILQRGLMETDNCTMCGELCAQKIVQRNIIKERR